MHVHAGKFANRWHVQSRKALFLRGWPRKIAAVGKQMPPLFLYDSAAELCRNEYGERIGYGTPYVTGRDF